MQAHVHYYIIDIHSSIDVDYICITNHQGLAYLFHHGILSKVLVQITSDSDCGFLFQWRGRSHSVENISLSDALLVPHL